MKCPYVDIECLYINTSGETKLLDCINCDNYDVHRVRVTGSMRVFEPIVNLLRWIKGLFIIHT